VKNAEKKSIKKGENQRKREQKIRKERRE